MHLRALAAGMAGAALLFGAHVVAADPPNFDFNGYAQIPGTSLGQPLAMYSVLTNNGVVPTPILLDFATNEYTMVIHGTVTGSSATAVYYAGAQVDIYSDARSGGTAADYAIPSSFTDGTLILSGAFAGNLARNTVTPTLGGFIGTVNFSGGTRLADLSTPDGWPCGGAWSRTISGIPNGFQEMWDGKIDLASVAVEPRTWGGVKRLYD
jgi:hypothetical protein